MDKSRILEAIRAGSIDPFITALYWKDSPSPPATPDYAGAAVAQGAANKETAQVQGRMNNPNIYTPYGSQTVSWGGTPQFDENAYNQAMSKYQTDLVAYQNAQQGHWVEGDEGGQTWVRGGGDPNATAPTAPSRDAFTTTPNADQATIRQTLSPEQQRLLDAQNAISQNLAVVAQSGLNRVSSGFETPFDTSNLPEMVNRVGTAAYQYGVDQPDLKTSYDAGGKPQYSTGFNQPVQQSFQGGSPIQGQVAGAGNVRTSYDPAGQQQTSFAGGGPIQTSFNPAGQQQTSLQDVGQAQRNLDFSGAPALPGTNDFSADRNAVTNALLSRTEPQFQRDEDLMRTRLINQGLAPGSEASNYDLDTLNRARNDARMQAVLAGGQEQSRLFGLASQARGQYTGEQAQQGNFANQAQQQAFSQGLAGGNFANTAQQAQFGQNLAGMQAANAAQGQQFGQNQAQGQFANAAQAAQAVQNAAAAQFANSAQGQLYGQNLAGGQFANQAQAQGFGQNQAQAEFQNQAQQQAYQQSMANLAAYNSAQQQANTQNQNAAQFGNQAALSQFGMGQQNAALNNQAAQQMFSQGLANANLTNQNRQQGIQEQAYLRSLPLNELNALRTGAQVQNPQFQPYQGVTVGQTPVFQGAVAQGQANQNAYNAQAANANAFNSGLFSLGSAAIGAPTGTFSDRRLKSEVVRIGTHNLGIGLYEYTIFGERQIGVMADEVETVMPEAVHLHGSGYKMVDYAMIGG